MRTSLIVAAIVSAAASAAAQDFPGDPEAGLAYARGACAECHVVAADQPIRDVSAASFRAIALQPGMTASALLAWLTTIPHPEMPNLIIPEDDLKNVVAYILSLQGQR